MPPCPSLVENLCCPRLTVVYPVSFASLSLTMLSILRHAWWHVLVSCGLYLLTVAVAYSRLRVLTSARGSRRVAQIEWLCAVLPVARIRDADHASSKRS